MTTKRNIGYVVLDENQHLLALKNRTLWCVYGNGEPKGTLFRSRRGAVLALARTVRYANREGLAQVWQVNTWSILPMRTA